VSASALPRSTSTAAAAAPCLRRVSRVLYCCLKTVAGKTNNQPPWTHKNKKKTTIMPPLYSKTYKQQVEQIYPET